MERQAETAEPRESENQASRDADEQAVATGMATWSELDRRNALLTAERTIVHWERAKPL